MKKVYLALLRIHKHFCPSFFYDSVQERQDFVLIYQGLRRNFPMKPIYEKNGTRSCPCCKANWLTPNFKFCSDCGQALDWSKDE